MDVKATEVAIIGGGQAGLALSYRLIEMGRPHVILEQSRLVESWRTKRWDSLRLIAPNWSMVLPGFAYPGDDPDGFIPHVGLLFPCVSSWCHLLSYSSWRRIQSCHPSSSSRPFGARSRIG